MSLDLSGWVSASECCRRYGFSRWVWGKHFWPHVKGLGKTIVLPRSERGGTYKVVYPPDIIKALVDRYRVRRGEIKRERRERLKEIKNESFEKWSSRMQWVNDFGYTPGSAGE